MDDWLEKVEQGAVLCRVLNGDEPVDEFIPTHVDQLWSSILIHDLGETVHGDFVCECQQFVQSGKSHGRYESEACSTIVKFGRAIQFKEPFIVEFDAIQPTNIKR